MASPRLSGTRIVEAILIAVCAGAMSAVGTIYVTTPVLAVKIEHLSRDLETIRAEIAVVNQRTVDTLIRKCPSIPN
jgi:hypothetical protein